MKFLIFVILAIMHQSAFAGFYPREADYGGEIGSQCQYDEDCISAHSYCRGNRVCDCKKKYMYDKSSLSCIATHLGLKCNVDDDCGVPNSRCFEETCQCYSNHIAADPSSDCLPSSRLQAQCIEDNQCRASDDNSHCNKEKQMCECLTGYHPSFDTQQCIKSKRVKDMCESHQECATTTDQQDKVECALQGSIHRCTCRSGYSEQKGICAKGYTGASSAIASMVSLIFILVLLPLLQ